MFVSLSLRCPESLISVHLCVPGARTREQLSTRFFLELPELPILEASSDDQQQLAALAEDRQLLAVIEETLATWQQDMARNLDGMINRVSHRCSRGQGMAYTLCETNILGVGGQN